MSDNKKYFWLKLKDDFFNQKEIKKLRKIAGGDTFTIIYLKLQLLSIKNDGKIFFENLEENFYQELALTIDEEDENVKVTLDFMFRCNLIEELSENEFLLSKVIESIGKESTSAERVRKHRQLAKENKQNLLQCNEVLLQCNDDVTICNTEIEIEKEKEKEIELDIEIEINKKNEQPLNKNERSFKQNIIDSKESNGEVKNKKNNIDSEIREKINEWTNNDDLKQALSNYIQHRKDIKKPVKTLNTLNLIFNQLDKNKVNAIEMLNQSILNGWVGLFEVRSTVKANNNQTSTNIFDEIGRERGLW